MALKWWQQALFLLALSVVLSVAGLANFLVADMERVVLPVKHWWTSGFSYLYSVTQNLQQLPKAAKRIQDLELRLAEASVSLAELETTKKENQALRALVADHNQLSERRIITAPVVAFAQPAIAAGELDGIQPGAIVLSNDTLLGQVREVRAHSATVALLFTQESQPILVTTSQGVQGLLIGDGKKIILTEVEKQAQLNLGDQLTTVGQPQIEQGIPVGRIIKITNDPVAATQEAIVEQYVSFFETPLVEVR